MFKIAIHLNFYVESDLVEKYILVGRVTRDSTAGIIVYTLSGTQIISPADT